MKNYHAEVINLSLKNKKILGAFEEISCEKRLGGLYSIHTIVIHEDEFEESVWMLQDNMTHALGKEWYITVHNSLEVYVIFRGKIFKLSGEGITPHYQVPIDPTNSPDREHWEEMLSYARSLGIPESQLDFLPEDFSSREY